MLWSRSGAREAGVTLWAEKPETAELFRSTLGELRDALTVADLDIDTLDVRDGAPAARQCCPRRQLPGPPVLSSPQMSRPAEST